jgi:hypothetical protein
VASMYVRGFGSLDVRNRNRQRCVSFFDASVRAFESRGGDVVLAL